MKKINFTKEHEEKLEKLALKFLMKNYCFSGTLGVYNVVNILHELTINTLIKMLNNFKKHLNTLEDIDEWVAASNHQLEVAVTKESIEFINLVIGWKRFNIQKEKERVEVLKLKRELTKLKEETMTPEDKIKAVEEKIKDLGGIV